MCYAKLIRELTASALYIKMGCSVFFDWSGHTYKLALYGSTKLVVTQMNSNGWTDCFDRQAQEKQCWRNSLKLQVSGIFY